MDRATTASSAAPPGKPRLLAHAPAELTEGRLRRIGEGIGRVVYASPHWVVKRERSPAEVVALIVLWKALRRMERWMPGGRRRIEHPGRVLHLLRVAVQAVVSVLPRGVWLATHIGEIWSTYHFRNRRGEELEREHLAGTHLVPERISFPPVQVEVGGWPGYLTVDHATERVEDTLYHRLRALAREGRFEEFESWLARLLEVRQEGWQRGVFSVDAHLKNFGVIGERVVLIDPGGLTRDWADIDRRLEFEDVLSEPHIQLGLGSLLGARPEVASRFNARWKAVVNRERVRRHWPGGER